MTSLAFQRPIQAAVHFHSNHCQAMKSSLFSLLLIVAMYTTGTAQGTTLQEYQLLQLDLPYQQWHRQPSHFPGYRLVSLWGNEAQSQMLGLYREQEESPCALVLVLRTPKRLPFYLVIPAPESDSTVQWKYQEQLNAIGADDLWKGLYLKSMQHWIYQQSQTGTHIRSTPKSAPDYSAPTPAVPKEELAEPPVATEPASMDLPAPYVTYGGSLQNRTIQVAPSLQAPYQGNGRLVLKVCVKADGTIKSARYTQSGSTTNNASLIQWAQASLQQMRFASASSEQCGTITFQFNP